TTEMHWPTLYQPDPKRIIGLRAVTEFHRIIEFLQQGEALKAQRRTAEQYQCVTQAVAMLNALAVVQFGKRSDKSLYLRTLCQGFLLLDRPQQAIANGIGSIQLFMQENAFPEAGVSVGELARGCR